MHLYVGLSGATLPSDHVDLGHGFSLQRTYAHLFSPCMMAFTPALPGKPHPAPWRAAKGGFSYDIHIELRVPRGTNPSGFAENEAAWWLVALLRLSYAPYLLAPVTINMPFADAATGKNEPTITPFELEPRLFTRGPDRSQVIPIEHLEWLKENWLRAASLVRKHPKMLTAIQAYDTCHALERPSSSLLTIWGALEQLFSPSTSELRYRVASNLAAYLAPRGEKRLTTYKEILKLYDARSVAAHTAGKADKGDLARSWIMLRNALMKMIMEDCCPSQADFEQLIFTDTSTVDTSAISWDFQAADPNGNK